MKTDPTFPIPSRADFGPVTRILRRTVAVLAAVLLVAGVGCFGGIPFQFPLPIPGLGGSFALTPPLGPHAFTSGGSPTTAASHAMSSADFRTDVAFGVISDIPKTVGNVRVREGYVPVILLNHWGGVSGKASVAPYYVSTDRAAVRSGPGPDHPVAATLYRGARVTVAGAYDGWRWVTEPVPGFVEPAALSGVPPERTLAGSLPEDRYVTAALLTVRLGPGESFPEEGRLTAGALVRVLNDESGWSLLEGPVTGYVETTGLSDEPEPPNGKTIQ